MCVIQDLAAVSKANGGDANEAEEGGAEGGEAPAEEGFPHEIMGFKTGI